jgi:hypothetical protein
MVRNLNFYDKYIRKHRKRQFLYTIALRALFEGRDNNPAREEFYNSLISGLKKKNQCWARMPVYDLFHVWDKPCFLLIKYSHDISFSAVRFSELMGRSILQVTLMISVKK